MTTAYTSLLGLALPVTGELSGTWGDTVNNSITSLLDTSVAGTTNVSTDTDVTLTTTTGAANTARQAILLFSGARTALRTVTAPAQSKIYTVINATTGGFSVKLVGAGPTTGVTIVAGESAVCAWNGSDFIKISNTAGSGSFTNLTASGTVTFTGLSASQAVFTNASDELVSNAITGTGNVVMSASPTLTGTITAAAITASGTVTFTGLTASQAVFTNASDELVSNAITGTGNVVMSASPTLTGTLTASAITASSTITGNGNWVLGNADTDTITQSASYVNGTVLRSSKSATNTLNLAAYDVDGAAYTNLITLTASNTPTLALTSTGVGTINNMSIGATTASTGAFTTLSASGAVTLSGGTANGVAYLNGSKVVTSGSALTFDPASRLNLVMATATATPTWNAVDAFRITGSSSGENYAIMQLHSGVASGTNGYAFAVGSTRSIGGMFYDNNTNALSFNQNSAEGMRLTSTGLGIGTSSPASDARLTLASPNTESYVMFSRTNSGVFDAAIGNSGGSLVFKGGADSSTVAGLTELMRLDSSGNLGLGNFTPYSTWGNSYKAFQVANEARSLAATGAGSGDLTLAFNAVYDSADNRWEYAGTGDKAGRYSQTGAGNHIFYVTNTTGTAGNAITFTQAMTLDASSNLIVGDTATQYSAKIYANGSIAARNGGVDGTFADAFVAGYTSNYTEKNLIQTAVSSGGTLSGFRFKASDGGGSSATTTVLDLTRTQTIFYTGGSERARIDSTGDLIIGTTTAINSAKVSVVLASNRNGISVQAGDNANYNYIGVNLSNTTTFYVMGTGSVYNSTGTYGTISDAKLKENIVDATPKLNDVMRLQVRNFNFKTEPNEKQLGFIAQELEQVFPALVEETSEKDAEGNATGEKTKQVKTSVLVPVLVKAIQEQQAIIESLKARLDAANL